ncbi:MAG TPA: asparagine synthase-related protein [Allosphingosinicella sp.]
MSELERQIERRWPGLGRPAKSRGLSLYGADIAVLDGELGRVIIAGDVWCAGGTEDADLSALLNAGNLLDAGALAGAVWGNYVAIFEEAGRGSASIFRDPSGARQAYVAADRGIAIVTSRLPPWLAHALNPAIGPDFHVLAGALAAPPVAAQALLLHQAVSVPPGWVADWSRGEVRLRSEWRPPIGSESPDREVGAAKLRGAVVQACSAVARKHQRILLQLSGGLDSAVVLGALASADPRPEIICVNFSSQSEATDERTYARAAAHFWGVDLVEIKLDHRSLDYSRLASNPVGAMPALYGLDNNIEDAQAALALSKGCTACVTGQGGDAVFFQFPTLLPLIDKLEILGLRALFSGGLADAARRSQSTIWTALRLILRYLVIGVPEAAPVPHLALLGTTARERLLTAARKLSSLQVHPAITPGKAFQLEAIANGQIFHTLSFAGSRLPVLHPLLSQPVVEASIAIPTFELTYGAADRALARDAFKDLLPEEIWNRRGKGETSDYHYRGLVRNLPFLRKWLLEGRLVAHGLLDRDVLDDALTEEALVHSDLGGMALPYASIEAWARAWGL